MHQPQSATSGQSAHLQPNAQTKEHALSAIKLTPKEKEVLAWGAQGKTSWEIALILKCTLSACHRQSGHASCSAFRKV